MLLLLPILVPLIAAALMLVMKDRAKMLGLAASAITLVTGFFLFVNSNCIDTKTFFTVLDDPNITFSLGITGISAVMLLLSVLVTFAALWSGKCPEGKEALWYSSIMLIAAGANGAFLSRDLFFFFSFHELALIPTFLTIGILGRGDRKAIAWKTTIYLALGSLVLLAGLLMAVQYGSGFDMDHLQVASEKQICIAAFLIVGFGTLVSLFPFHSWAAPAYASAPAPVAMLHSGVLKKFGLYGLLVVGFQVAPEGMQYWVPTLLVLLLGNIIWVGYVTINQKRLDFLLGNSSVMHMGYIFLALAALAADPTRTIAVPAAVLLMFAHGISIAMSFNLADTIERKTKTLELNRLGGLAKKAPSLAFLFGLASMASIGLPGLANFAGEALVFFSGFQNWDYSEGLGNVQWTTIIAIWGVVISAVYMLRAFRNTFHGPTASSTEEVKDLHWCEKVAPALMAAALLIVGLYPNLLIKKITGESLCSSSCSVPASTAVNTEAPKH